VFPCLHLIRTLLTLIGKPARLLARDSNAPPVWSDDLNFNPHANDARYRTVVDIACLHWFARAGILAVARRQRVFPIAGDAIAKFRRDLIRLESVEIKTRLLRRHRN